MTNTDLLNSVQLILAIDPGTDMLKLLIVIPNLPFKLCFQLYPYPEN